VTAPVVAICAAVYLGMILGALPFLQLDRTGIALLGAIALVGIGALTPEQAALSVHLPTLLLLFSFMVIAAQMRLGGFYDWVTLRLAALPLRPAALLAAVIGAVALLSAVFSNDVVCLAVAPALADACARRRLDPTPFLLALACSANVGSAATLIGNPQNMLIGQVLNLSFSSYLLEASVPVLGGLVAIWALIALGYTLVYGIIELINFAHGDLFMIGSFISYGFFGTIGLTLATGTLGLVLGLVVTMLLGPRPVNTEDKITHTQADIGQTRKDINGTVYGAEQAISREEALRLYTSSASWYSFSESKTGSIEPGKLADLAILSHDPLTVPEETLKSITVRRTIVGGKTVYQSPP